MTATPAPALTAAELAIVAAFDAAPTPPEITEAAVLEEVARAMEAACTDDATWLSLAAAAVAAYRAQDGGAEEAVRRVEALIDPGAEMALNLSGSRYFEEKDIRAALAPQAGDGAR